MRDREREKMNKEIKRELFERQVDDDWDCSATKMMLNDEAMALAKLEPAKKKAAGSNDKSEVPEGSKRKRLDIRVRELAHGFFLSKH
jgi:hypothetical protein